VTRPIIQKGRDTTNSPKISVGSDYGRRRPATLSDRRKRINFLIRLSEIDLAALATSNQPGDLINLAYDFFGFGILYPGRGFGRPIKSWEDWADLVATDWTEFPTAEADAFAAQLKNDPSILEPTQDAVLRLLAAAANHRGIGVELLKGTAMIFDARLDGHERTTFLAPAEPDAPRQALRQTVTLATALALSGAGAELVRRCKREQCPRIFLASRPNQEYCSRKCVNIAGFERHKAKIGEETYRVKHAQAMKKSRRRGQRTNINA